MDMSLPYAYTPQIWPMVFTITFLIALAAFSWRRRSVPGAQMFIFSCLFAGLASVGLAMTYLAVEFQTKIIWYRFEYTWLLPAATATTCFILEYAWPGRWLTRRNLALLSITPVMLAVTIWTNGFFSLSPPSFMVGETVRGVFGPTGTVFILYTFGLTLINLAVFAWLFLRSPQHRWPVALMVISQIAMRYLLIKEISQLGILVFNIPVYAIPYLAYASALFGFRIFDPVPLARQTVIDQLHAGMLVLDQQGRVASLNLVAERMLQMSANHAKGKPIRELLSSYSELNLDTAGRTVIEFNLPEDRLAPMGTQPGRGHGGGVGEGTAIRDFTLEISPLKDWRGLEAGRLLMLRDVTEPKRARELQKQQQLLLTVLQERERLARELHDSLGQTLAAAHLQASTARVFLAQGDTAQTDQFLEQLTDMTIAAEADVREYLLGAKTAFLPDHPFFFSLRQYVLRFSQQYGLQVELSVPPQLEAQGLGAAVEVQLLRIIQEALSNVRKHACAKNVRVTFTDSRQQVQVAILDDGRGFDSAPILEGQVQGFGLQAMRERAETLGGCLEVISQPGQGTQVVVMMPFMRDAETR
jgi:signal transduction histidine kinase